MLIESYGTSLYAHRRELADDPEWPGGVRRLQFDASGP
jgi:hypothetical protein